MGASREPFTEIGGARSIERLASSIPTSCLLSWLTLQKPIDVSLEKSSVSKLLGVWRVLICHRHRRFLLLSKMLCSQVTSVGRAKACRITKDRGVACQARRDQGTFPIPWVQVASGEWRRTSTISVTLKREVRSHNAAKGASMSEETIPHPSPRGVSTSIISSTTAGSPHTHLLCTNHHNQPKKSKNRETFPH